MTAWPLNMENANYINPYESWLKYQVQSFLNMQECPTQEQVEETLQKYNLVTRRPLDTTPTRRGFAARFVAAVAGLRGRKEVPAGVSQVDVCEHGTRYGDFCDSCMNEVVNDFYKIPDSMCKHGVNFRYACEDCDND